MDVTEKERWDLVMSVKPIMVLFAKKWMIPAERREDLYHDAMIKLYNRAPSYDPERGSWEAFAWWVLRERISNGNRHYDQIFGPKRIGKPKPTRSVVTTEDFTGPDWEAFVGSDWEHVDNSIDAERLRACSETISPRLRRALCGHVDGETYKSIAEEMGVTRQRVMQLRVIASERVVAKLKAQAKHRAEMHGQAQASRRSG